MLPNDQVLVAGGYDIGEALNTLNSAELYDTTSGTWSFTGAMATARSYHTATSLPNGQVLVAGGNTGSGATNTAELYDPTGGTWTNTGAMASAREFHTATLLPNGLVLVAGGDINGTGMSSAELYDPITWMPFVTSPKPVSVRLTVNFAPGKLEQASVSGSFALPAGFSLTNRTATLTVGGAAVEFPLSAKGEGISGSSRLKISLKTSKPKDGGAAQTIGTVTATLKGDWQTPWAACGLTNATVASNPVTVPVRLVFDTADPTAFSIDKNLVYKATAGKSGQAK